MTWLLSLLNCWEKNLHSGFIYLHYWNGYVCVYHFIKLLIKRSRFGDGAGKYWIRWGSQAICFISFWSWNSELIIQFFEMTELIWIIDAVKYSIFYQWNHYLWVVKLENGFVKYVIYLYSDLSGKEFESEYSLVVEKKW